MARKTAGVWYEKNTSLSPYVLILFPLITAFMKTTTRNYVKILYIRLRFTLSRKIKSEYCVEGFELNAKQINRINLARLID